MTDLKSAQRRAYREESFSQQFITPLIQEALNAKTADEIIDALLKLSVYVIYGARPAEAITNGLRPLLTHENIEVRWRAAHLLFAINPRHFHEPALADLSAQQQIAALRRLEFYAAWRANATFNPSAVLEQLLQSENADVRRQALESYSVLLNFWRRYPNRVSWIKPISASQNFARFYSFDRSHGGDGLDALAQMRTIIENNQERFAIEQTKDGETLLQAIGALIDQYQRDLESIPSDADEILTLLWPIFKETMTDGQMYFARYIPLFNNPLSNFACELKSLNDAEKKASADDQIEEHASNLRATVKRINEVLYWLGRDKLIKPHRLELIEGDYRLVGPNTPRVEPGSALGLLAPLTLLGIIGQGFWCSPSLLQSLSVVVLGVLMFLLLHHWWKSTQDYLPPEMVLLNRNMFPSNVTLQDIANEPDSSRKNKMTTMLAEPRRKGFPVQTTLKAVKTIQSVLKELGEDRQELLLFGSFADGRQHEWSDVDIAIPHLALARFGPSVIGAELGNKLREAGFFRVHVLVYDPSSLHDKYGLDDPIQAKQTHKVFKNGKYVWSITSKHALKLDLHDGGKVVEEINPWFRNLFGLVAPFGLLGVGGQWVGLDVVPAAILAFAFIACRSVLSTPSPDANKLNAAQRLARAHAEILRRLAAERKISGAQVANLIGDDFTSVSQLNVDTVLFSHRMPFQMKDYEAALKQELKGWDKGNLGVRDIANTLMGGHRSTKPVPNKNEFIVVKDASAGQVAYAKFMRAGMNRQQTLYIGCTNDTWKELKNHFTREDNVIPMLDEGLIKNGAIDNVNFEQNLRELKHSKSLPNFFHQTILVLAPDMESNAALVARLKTLRIDIRPLTDWLPNIEKGNWENILRATMAAWEAA